jgi:signal transduction histidine kinase
VTLDAIRSVDLFEGLDDDGLEEWREATQAFRIASGEIVHEQDTSPRGLLLLLEGQTRMYKLADERFEPIGHMHAPTWMQAIAALTETPVGVRMVAEGDCVIGLVPIATFQELALKYRTVHRKIMKAIGPVTARLQAIDNDRERLASLGTMAAGLAHELNNPAAAVRRAAEAMGEALDVLGSAPGKFIESGIARSEVEKIVALQREAIARAAEMDDDVDALDAADAEDELLERLEDLGVHEPWKLAEPLAAAGLDQDWLDRLYAVATDQGIDPSLEWIASSLSARSLADELRESAERMSNLVGAVKTYAYMDRGGVVEVDVHEGLKTTMMVLKHKLKHTSIEVVKDFDKTLPKITVHGSELNQVWTNLIDNAIAAMGEAGTLTLRTSRDGPCVLVEVTDDGPGIPPEVIDHVFDPFFTTKDVGEGTGLGLDTARRIVVERHDGSITVDSRPGETTFHVWLPIKE